MNNIEKLKEVKNQVSKVILGKDQVINKTLATILAGGHILLEDIPGVGKTTLSLAFSKALGLDFSRLQFTPDTVPSDITGFSVYDRDSKSFSYKKGGAMCNFFLGDEINRTSSKTQAALLEIMEEKKISLDGNEYKLPKPFIVMATQNPFGMGGTQKLPEAQLDRFMVRLSLGYPDIESQISILKDRELSNPLDKVEAVLKAEEIEAIKEDIKGLFVDPKIYRYIATLVERTRCMDEISLGVSPRGALALYGISKATAYIKGRDYVVPEDVDENLLPVFGHRIILSQKSRSENMKKEEIINKLLDEVEAPRAN